MTASELISNVWKHGEIFLPKEEAQDISTDTLYKEGMKKVVVDADNVKICKFDRDIPQADTQGGHKYIMPPFTDEIELQCKDAMEGKSFNILLTGAAGTGKTEFVHYIAKNNGFSRVFQVNGRNDMCSTDFFGQKTAKIDSKTEQNYIAFEKGPLYQAFIEGTELDADGNQILYNEDGTVCHNGNGNPKVVGAPALFFLDEFAVIDSEVFLSVFNQSMLIPNAPMASRMMTITDDAGRIVKSHPCFAMFFAGNTVGSGTENESQMGYTAQNKQLDFSSRNRFTAFYKFGYNKKAEKLIALNKLNDDKDADMLIRFVNEIRKQWKEGHVETLITTRNVVQICNLARSFRRTKKDYLTKAIYRSVFCELNDRESHAWNETIRMIFGCDLLAEEKRNDDYEYAEKV